jgi:regulatory protein
VRSLRVRPLSERRLRERLRTRGIRADAEEAALATLSDAGFVDDAQLARGRALALAERGWGDAGIAARLESEGLPEPEVGEAIASLEPESERSRRVIRGLARRKAWGLLQRRGFDRETIASVLGDLDEGEAEGLG